MLDFLISWAEQVIVSLIIIVVIEMILPTESSYKKYIKVILGIFLLYVIISQILNSKVNDMDFSKAFAIENEVELKEQNNAINYDGQVEKMYKVKLEEDLGNFLNEKEYTLLKLDTDLKYENEEITINELKLKIKMQASNKNIVVNKVEIKDTQALTEDEKEKIISEISDYYEIEKSKILISESEN